MTEEQIAETPPEGTPEGTTEFVEMDEKTEARFKRIYGNMKQYERQAADAERIAKQAAQDNAKLVERLEKREEAETQKTTDELRQEERAALEEQDFERATNARDKLTALEVERQAPKPEPKAEEPPPMDPGLKDRLNDWAAEKDGEGNLLRPWADSAHEDNASAIKMVTGILASSPNAPLDSLLDEIDKETKKLFRKPARNAPAVLSGDGGVRPKAATKTKLSSDQKAIAERMYPSMKPAEAAKRYADAMEKYA